MIPSLISHIVLVLTLAATLLLFLSVKREIQVRASRERQRVDALVNAMAERLRDASTPPPEPVYLPVTLRSGLNISNRIQAMRMLRRGEDVAHTAAALGVPGCEIELLRRVEAIVSKPKAVASRF
jgi:hypothetical protein